MTTEEAMKLAEEAVINGHLNKYPQACIALAKEVKRLQKKLEQSGKSSNSTKEEGNA